MLNVSGHVLSIFLHKQCNACVFIRAVNLTNNLSIYVKCILSRDLIEIEIELGTFSLVRQIL